MTRIKFKSSNVRDNFFNKANQQFGSWNAISQELKINRYTLLRYRQGKLLLPLDIFNKINKISDFKEEIIMFDSNWGRKKGGQSTYQKHSEILRLGREKLMAYHKLSDNKVFDLNLNSTELAEFMGVLIGDGFIGNYNKRRMMQITGNKINDKIYYNTFLVPLVKKLFNVNVHFHERKTCLRLSVYSKVLFNTLVKLFDFPVGKKNKLFIPSQFLKNRELKIAIIRGIFDTDGGINCIKKGSPNICITTTSEILAYQINDILKEFDLDPDLYICKKGKKNKKNPFRIYIYTPKKILKWKNLIGSSNPYHLDRIDTVLTRLTK